MHTNTSDLAALIELSSEPCPTCGKRLHVATQLPARTARLMCADGHDVTPNGPQATPTETEPA